MTETAVEAAALRDRVASLPGWGEGDIGIEPAIPLLASPSWRGVDGFPWRATRKSTGESVFIKVMDRDAELYVDIPCAFADQPFAIARDSDYKNLAGRLLDAILSRESRERFAEYGFTWKAGAKSR